VLGRSGQAFWQDESYDHWIRSARELEEIISYVEGNPVNAGLVSTEEQWPWSSARFRADDCSWADQDKPDWQTTKNDGLPHSVSSSLLFRLAHLRDEDILERRDNAL
jgi:hypothetical protein